MLPCCQVVFWASSLCSRKLSKTKLNFRGKASHMLTWVVLQRWEVTALSTTGKSLRFWSFSNRQMKTKTTTSPLRHWYKQNGIQGSPWGSYTLREQSPLSGFKTYPLLFTSCSWAFLLREGAYAESSGDTDHLVFSVQCNYRTSANFIKYTILIKYEIAKKTWLNILITQYWEDKHKDNLKRTKQSF